jgi:cytidylate kinase
MLEGIVEASCSERHSSMTATKKNIIICVAGLTACGKSTAARRLAEKYGLKYVSGGTALKEYAWKIGYKAKGRDWWETSEGMRFLEQRLRDPKFDKQIDAKLLEWAERGNVVLDSWTMPWLTKKGFKIWLEVSPRERAKRLARRDGISVEEAARVIREKDGKTKRIYESLYGFKLGEDYSPFDLVLDSESLTSDEVFDTLSLVIDRLVLERRAKSMRL